MFIDLTSTAPVLDHQRCPKQLIIRVAHLLSGYPPDPERGVVGELVKPRFWRANPDRATFHPFEPWATHNHRGPANVQLREYMIRPQLFQEEGEGPFEFRCFSEILYVTAMSVTSSFTLNYDGEGWDLGLDGVTTGSVRESTRFWIPLPEYDPMCLDATPLYVTTAVVEPRTIWERLDEEPSV